MIGRVYAELGRRSSVCGGLADWVKECAKSKLHIVRTYQETITDAIEAGYALRMTLVTRCLE